MKNPPALLLLRPPGAGPETGKEIKSLAESIATTDRASPWPIIQLITGSLQPTRRESPYFFKWKNLTWSSDAQNPSVVFRDQHKGPFLS